jgi:anti-sigma regulatory factor (Ser/Thr protein kinase)
MVAIMTRSDALSDSERDNQIELIVPARTDMASTVRLVAASLGADVGLTLDEIDDVRLALDEIFSSAAEHADDTSVSPGDRISVTFRPGDRRLDVIVFVVGDRTITLDPLATRILASVADDFQNTAGAFMFSKSAAEAFS